MTWLLVLAACFGPGDGPYPDDPPVVPDAPPVPDLEPVPEDAEADDGPIRVWIDADTSAGVERRDIDDAVALIQAFHSEQLEVVGVSTVFGNSTLADTDRLGREVTEKFGPEGLPVHTGAAAAGEQDTDAVKALAGALDNESLTILVLGPATNVAGVLKKRPDLAAKMTEIVAVAGRRPGQRFTTGTTNNKGHRDFNFEQDPEAFAAILEADVSLTLTPWEVSSRVWITDNEIERWKKGNDATQWLAAAVPSWIGLWKAAFAVDGFNPFDTLAVGYLTDPELFTCETWPVGIETHPGDVTDPALQGDDKPEDKPYLLLSEELPYERRAKYCHTVAPEFRERLMERLLRG